jgi:hypothetical protein
MQYRLHRNIESITKLLYINVCANVGVFMSLSLNCDVCPKNRTALAPLRVRSIFYLGHFQVRVEHATEPFVLHAWLLRKSQLKYGKITDNHIAGKKTHRTTSICCDL